MGRLGIELRQDGVSFEGYVCLDCGAGLGKTTPRASKHVCVRDEGILIGVADSYKVGNKIGASMTHWLEVIADDGDGNYRYRDLGLVDVGIDLGKCQHPKETECQCCDDPAHRIMSNVDPEETRMRREEYSKRKANGRRNDGGDEPAEAESQKEPPEVNPQTEEASEGTHKDR